MNEYPTIDNVSLTTAAVRMMACFAYSRVEAAKVVAHSYTEPVLAIQATVRHGEEVFHDCLVYDADEALVSVTELLDGTGNLAGSVVITPWPPDEDEDRLAVRIAGLKARAIEPQRAAT